MPCLHIECHSPSVSLPILRKALDRSMRAFPNVLWGSLLFGLLELTDVIRGRAAYHICILPSFLQKFDV